MALTNINAATGQTEVIPNAYVSYTVANGSVGLATSGVVVLVGEALCGPSYTQESDITLNVFAPTQLDAVKAKYVSGPLVDAFATLVAPSSDPQIQGAVTAVYLVKTNTGTAAASNLIKSGFTTTRELTDYSWGRLGNSTYYSVTAAVPEVVPTTGLTTFVPNYQSASLGVRLNGGALSAVSFPALTTPAVAVTNLNGATGVLATGGVNRLLMTGITASSSLAFTVNTATTATITLSGAASSWGTVPSVGDTLVIPGSGSDYGAGAASVIYSAADKNAGVYIVTSATATTINVTKLAHDTGNAYTLTNVSAVAVSATPTNDLAAYSPVVINNQTGVDRGLLTGLTGKSVTVTVNGTALTATISAAVWNALPQVGDYVYIPSGSAYQGAGNANVGYYSVTAATTTAFTATRLSNGNPIAVSATNIVAATDLQCQRPVIDGVGKTLSLFDNSGTANVSNFFYTTSGSLVNWLVSATNLTPILSASEYKAQFNIARQSTSTQETWAAGGDVVLQVSYNGTSATLTVTSANTFSTTVVGGTGASIPSTSFADFKTLNDVATFINSKTGYTAAVGSALFGQLPGYVLDQGTFNIGASFLGSLTGRLKKDAYAINKVLSQSLLTKFLDASTGNPVVFGGALAGAVAPYVTTGSGLPEVQAQGYLVGGTTGGTSNTIFASAVDACAKMRLNFIVPLFSRNASLDITDGLTDSTSTYTIDSMNAYVSTHVTAMSQLKKRRNRQGFLSKKDTFLNAQLAASNIANARCSFFFQDVKVVAASGSIVQQQPWMGAVLAAGMQAAGAYRAIFNKQLNISGIVQAAGDFNDLDDALVETALLNGLLVVRRAPTGGFTFADDNTTYGVDNNFVYNSIQAVYAADVVALTAANDMAKRFVGQSLADISAAVMLSELNAIMNELLRLKWIAPSQDAAMGFKNASIKIVGPVALVKCEVKLATAIYFIDINFLFSEVVSSAS